MSELRVDELSATYGLASALSGVSLKLAKGETVGLLGRNGAGKTTLLKAIINDSELTISGEVSLDGASLSKQPTFKIARQGVAWVPDNRRIFTALSVRENLEIARAKGTGKDLFERVVACIPLMEKLLDRRGYELSGGEQQAVTIARSLMSEPDFVLLDEPTEGLSPLIVEELQRAIKQLPKLFDCGLLIAEQNFSFVTDLSQRVHILETGRMVWAGTPAQLTERPDLIDTYLSVGGH